MGIDWKDNMVDEERLPDTLTPKDGAISPQPDTGLGRMPWGRLIACKSFLESIDLVESFTFGRSEQCSMVVTVQSCPKNALLNISKIHFRIEMNSDDNIVYITDLSKNGTFVNRNKLGSWNRKILKNDDVIALAVPGNSFYVFRSHQIIEDFLPAELIPKYANIRLLGRGSCGEVRLVKDRDTFNQYAIKKIILGESNSSQMGRINHPTKIRREIEILRVLKHPCIVRFEDIVQCDREMYLVLEYMAGGELTNRVLDCPMTEDTAKFYFLQMLYAVQYLHSQGVIHRDLKPENILLLDHRQETILKITDFGLSKVTNASDMTTMCGTLRYVAPEVINKAFREHGEYGKKVDVWSLGVILFFMISRNYPFRGEDHAILAENIVKCSLDMTGYSWSKVSSEVKDLIQRILVVEPKRRVNILNVFFHPWIKKEKVHRLAILDFSLNTRKLKNEPLFSPRWKTLYSAFKELYPTTKDYGVKFRVENLLQQEGLENPLQDLVLEPPEKKFKFNNNGYSSSSGSSGELNSTLVYNDGGSSYSSGSTICY